MSDVFGDRPMPPVPPSLRDRVRFSFLTRFFSCSSPMRAAFLVFVSVGCVLTWAENLTRRLVWVWLLGSTALPPLNARLDSELFLRTDVGERDWANGTAAAAAAPAVAAVDTLAASPAVVAEAACRAERAVARRSGRGGGTGGRRRAVACAAAWRRSGGERCRWETRLVRLGDAGRPSKRSNQ